MLSVLLEELSSLLSLVCVMLSWFEQIADTFQRTTPQMTSIMVATMRLRRLQLLTVLQPQLPRPTHHHRHRRLTLPMPRAYTKLIKMSW